jgi:hypothetical protein
MEAASRADEVDEVPTAAADGSAIGGAPLDEATKLAAEPKIASRKPWAARPAKKGARHATG